MATTRRRRRANADQMVTIYWRDIPAQVTTSVAGSKGSWLLGERFQVAIDRAATVAGLTDADDYVLEWRRVAEPLPAQPPDADGARLDPEVAAKAHAEHLESLYPSDRVRALVDNGGLDPESDQP